MGKHNQQTCELTKNRVVQTSFSERDQAFLIEAKRIVDDTWIKSEGLPPAGYKTTLLTDGSYRAESYMYMSTEAAFALYRDLGILFHDHKDTIQPYLDNYANNNSDESK